VESRGAIVIIENDFRMLRGRYSILAEFIVVRVNSVTGMVTRFASDSLVPRTETEDDPQ